MTVKSTLPEFQFHKGTIKTGLRRYGKGHFGYFNSIKVRLKRAGMKKFKRS